MCRNVFLKKSEIPDVKLLVLKPSLINPKTEALNFDPIGKVQFSKSPALIRLMFWKSDEEGVSGENFHVDRDS